MNKKMLIACSIAAVAMASCSSDEDSAKNAANEPQAIGVSTYINDDSRGVLISPDGGYNPTPAPGLHRLPFEQSGFLLYANVHQGSDNKTVGLMNAQKIIWNDAAVDYTQATIDKTPGFWTYAPIKYWPTDINSTVDFYPRWTGIAPSVDEETSDAENIKITYDWNNIPQVTFYVNPVVSKQSDYLWSKPLLGKKWSDHASDPDFDASGALNFKFEHALSGFDFMLKADLPAAQASVTRVTVNYLTLSGYFAPKATLKPMETDIHKIWNLEGDWEKRSYTISKEGFQEVQQKADYVGTYHKRIAWTGTNNGSGPFWRRGYMFLLPFQNDSYEITLSYNIITYPDAATHDADTGFTGAGGEVQTYVVTRKVELPAGQTLQPGYLYINRLTLDLHSIDVTAEQIPWIESNQAISIP